MGAVIRSLVHLLAQDLSAVQLQLYYLFLFLFLHGGISIKSFDTVAREAIWSPDLRCSQRVRRTELSFFVALRTLIGN